MWKGEPLSPLKLLDGVSNQLVQLDDRGSKKFGYGQNFFWKFNVVLYVWCLFAVPELL